MQNQRPKIHHLTPGTSLLIRISNWFEVHPKSLQHFMRGSLAVVVAFTLFNAGLFTVQNGRVPAFTKIGNVSYGNLSVSDANAKLSENFKDAQLVTKINDQTVQTYIRDDGIAINADKTFAAFTNKHGWLRIPVINAVHSLFVSAKPIFNIDEEKLAASLSPYVTSQSVDPVEPTIAVPTDPKANVTVKDSAPGHDLNPSIAAEEVMAEIQKGDFTADIKPVTLEPRFTASDVERFMPTITSARGTNLTISNDTQKITLSSDVLAPMLKLDTTSKNLKLTLDAGLLKAYIEANATVFYEAPVASSAVEKDGTEISRVEGRAGQQIDIDGTVAQAITAFESGVSNITPKLATVTADTLVTKTYSNTSEGLYKTIEDFAATHAGSYSVAAVELSGSGNRNAFYNADASIVTASTFKLFVAYAVLQDVESGKITMDTQTGLGSVSDCMYKMIHVSDNDCGAALQSLVGYNNLQKRLIADGMPNSNLITTDTSDKHSTARDEMTLVTKLYNKELLNEADTNYLFGLMEDQIFRSGIPAGSHGSVVADKVGFLYALNHDIGVVYSPNATYALVVMTDGAGGWNNVRLLADQVYQFYNQ